MERYDGGARAAGAAGDRRRGQENGVLATVPGRVAVCVVVLLVVLVAGSRQ